MVQHFPATQLQQCLCLVCMWGCIFMLKDDTSWQITCLGHWKETWEVVCSTLMRKWKWLFMNGCECKSLMSTAKECLKLCHGVQMQQCAKELLKSNELSFSAVNKWAKFNFATTSYWIFVILEFLLTEQPYHSYCVLSTVGPVNAILCAKISDV